MGIRFNCPNGHRLNVKAFLAGKTGICPRCGVSFIIPSETQSLHSSQRPDAPKSLPDPLAEAPEAQWYVCRPGGEPAGPASADEMRTWIAQGRIPPEALLWREGWTDWATASTVLPRLAAVPKVRPTVSEPPVGAKATASPPPAALFKSAAQTAEPSAQPALANFQLQTEERGLAGRNYRASRRQQRRRSRDRSTMIVGVLASLVVVLAALFYWVLTR